MQCRRCGTEFRRPSAALKSRSQLRAALTAVRTISPRRSPNPMPSRYRWMAWRWGVAACAALVACGGGGGPVATPGELAQLSNATNIAAIAQLPAPAAGSFSFIVVGDNRSGDSIWQGLVTQMNGYINGT